MPNKFYFAYRKDKRGVLYSFGIIWGPNEMKNLITLILFRDKSRKVDASKYARIELWKMIR